MGSRSPFKNQSGRPDSSASGELWQVGSGMIIKSLSLCPISFLSFQILASYFIGLYWLGIFLMSLYPSMICLKRLTPKPSTFHVWKNVVRAENSFEKKRAAEEAAAAEQEQEEAKCSPSNSLSMEGASCRPWTERCYKEELVHRALPPEAEIVAPATIHAEIYLRQIRHLFWKSSKAMKRLEV